LQPGLGCWKCTKGDDEDLYIQPLQFFLMLAQLRHMLAAGQSAQVAQEYQQHMTLSAQRIAHRNPAPVYGPKLKSWGVCTYSQHGVSLCNSVVLKVLLTSADGHHRGLFSPGGIGQLTSGE